MTLRTLARLLNGEPKRPRTRLVAIYPDGREFTIFRKAGAWWWDHGKGSFPLASAVEHVEELGGRVERRPIARHH